MSRRKASTKLSILPYMQKLILKMGYFKILSLIANSISMVIKEY